MNDDLVAFLRARLDEDERLAADAAKHCASLIAAAARTEGIWEPPYDGSAWGSSADHVYAADPRGDQPRADIADFGAGAFMLTPHIQNHSPARVLVEVDAKRRMIALHEQAATDTESSDYLVAGPGRMLLVALDPVVRLLALPYRAHPDYRPEWAPAI
ncbi:hypothetical protein P3T35_003156 [Kitasatospora sp. GP30]|uniref:DUF6221 family protein n=1 Tax=Kitasatospora sp. GP30 TaxID=3035084 RepID=UPI000C70D485|nr:DUF6221 family protein [Kitasatospora sp. GP30]MDH6141143.1 hypothetical protein [Kitasatospora sp. GP30]